MRDLLCQNISFSLKSENSQKKICVEKMINNFLPLQSQNALQNFAKYYAQANPINKLANKLPNSSVQSCQVLTFYFTKIVISGHLCMFKMGNFYWAGFLAIWILLRGGGCTPYPESPLICDIFYLRSKSISDPV